MAEEEEFIAPEIPKSKSSFMNFVKGENKFRVLGSPVVGQEYWQEKDDKKVPVRLKPTDKIDHREEGAMDAKYFWAMPVWNYEENDLQVLQVTQKSVLKKIKLYADNEKWGNPRGYDLVVTKTGEAKQTRYETIAEPHSDLTDEIKERWEDVKKAGFDLNRLYENENPFGKKDESEEEQEQVEAEAKTEEGEVDVSEVFPE